MMSTKNGSTVMQPREDTPKDYTALNIAEGVAYSKVFPHTAAAGDPYYIGDAYDDVPLQISQEWETDLCVMSPLYEPMSSPLAAARCAL